jgi:hypothetical protein
MAGTHIMHRTRGFNPIGGLANLVCEYLDLLNVKRIIGFAIANGLKVCPDQPERLTVLGNPLRRDLRLVCTGI